MSNAMRLYGELEVAGETAKILNEPINVTSTENITIEGKVRLIWASVERGREFLSRKEADWCIASTP